MLTSVSSLFIFSRKSIIQKKNQICAPDWSTYQYDDFINYAT